MESVLAKPYFALFTINYISVALDNDILTFIKQLYLQSPHTYFIKRGKDAITLLKVDLLKCTVKDVKLMIFEKIGTPVNSQILLYQGIMLVDDKRLVDCMILHGKTIHVMIGSVLD